MEKNEENNFDKNPQDKDLEHGLPRDEKGQDEVSCGGENFVDQKIGDRRMSAQEIDEKRKNLQHS